LNIRHVGDEEAINFDSINKHQSFRGYFYLAGRALSGENRKSPVLPLEQVAGLLVVLHFGAKFGKGRTGRRVAAFQAAFDCGGAGTQGLLTAVDEGLGVCWTAFNTEVAKKMLEIPDEWIPLFVLNVGYPLESREAGGQRPRPPFEELYFEGKVGVPFDRDSAVVEELTAEKLFTDPAPSEGRQQEILEIAEKLGLPT